MLYRNGKMPSSPIQAMFEDFVLAPRAYLQNFVCNFSVTTQSYQWLYMDLKYGAISQQVNGKNKSISISQKKQTP
jgi:hypothetical protein